MLLYVQVAKDLIEQAGKAGGPPSRPSIPLAELTAPESLLKLLQYRQQALAAQIAGAMGAASKAAAAQGAGATTFQNAPNECVHNLVHRLQAACACLNSQL